MHGEDANGAPPGGGARLAQYTMLLPLVTRALDGCPLLVVKVGVLSKESGERTEHREHREAPLVVCSGMKIRVANIEASQRTFDFTLVREAGIEPAT
jgi:hypothetical protein